MQGNVTPDDHIANLEVKFVGGQMNLAEGLIGENGVEWFDEQTDEQLFALPALASYPVNHIETPIEIPEHGQKRLIEALLGNE